MPELIEVYRFGLDPAEKGAVSYFLGLPNRTVETLLPGFAQMPQVDIMDRLGDQPELLFGFLGRLVGLELFGQILRPKAQFAAPLDESIAPLLTPTAPLFSSHRVVLGIAEHAKIFDHDPGVVGLDGEIRPVDRSVPPKGSLVLVPDTVLEKGFRDDLFAVKLDDFSLEGFLGKGAAVGEEPSLSRWKPARTIRSQSARKKRIM